MAQTQNTTNLDEWIADQTAAINAENRRREAEEREKAQHAREQQIDECNKMLADWGVPLLILADDATFPRITIDGHVFRFCGRDYSERYGRLDARLRHVVKTADGEDVYHADVQGPWDLAMWLNGTYVHPLPAPKQPRPEHVAPDIYRSSYHSRPNDLVLWLNDQHEQGYELAQMSATAEHEGASGVWVIVRKDDEPNTYWAVRALLADLRAAMDKANGGRP